MKFQFALLADKNYISLSLHFPIHSGNTSHLSLTHSLLLRCPLSTNCCLKRGQKIEIGNYIQLQSTRKKSAGIESANGAGSRESEKGGNRDND